MARVRREEYLSCNLGTEHINLVLVANLTLCDENLTRGQACDFCILKIAEFKSR